MAGHTVVHHLFPNLTALQPPRWLEPLLEATTTTDGKNAPLYLSNILSAEIVESLLAADSFSPDLIYGPAFPKKPNDWGTNMMQRLPEQASRLRRPDRLTPRARARSARRSFGRRAVLALEAFEKLQIPDSILPGADRTAGDIDRENGARSRIKPDHPAGEEALPALRASAESGRAKAQPMPSG